MCSEMGRSCRRSAGGMLYYSWEELLLMYSYMASVFFLLFGVVLHTQSILKLLSKYRLHFTVHGLNLLILISLLASIPASIVLALFLGVSFCLLVQSKMTIPQKKGRGFYLNGFCLTQPRKKKFQKSAYIFLQKKLQIFLNNFLRSS